MPRLLLLLLVLTPAPLRADYDPGRPGPAGGEPIDLDARDAKRSRDIPVRVFLPADKRPAPVVLFSHGLGGSRANSAYLGRHWSARGYAVVFVQHPGSDESVWRGLRPGERMAAMREAASAANFRLRAADVPAALDALASWNAETSHRLFGRLDLSRVGMSGHSFGAVTTQAVSGQAFPLGLSLTDPRIKAAVMMSPSPPRAGDPGRAFGKVSLPWLLLTGTADGSPIGEQKPADRLKVFPALPAGDKYELVLNGAEHSAFSERALSGEKGGRNPNHHRAILAVSTAFWDAHLRGDADARAWLDGNAVRGVLESADRWRRK